ncbi:MAG: alcohol dehydrogenase catalytic domain-containing protein, partial [Bacteroidales bacterium]|nr:alcohol dehydrogenase catalytic domain-containing protein [Bacteroidales bacterium]
MKALVKSKPEKGLWMEEVDIPEVGVNDILIKVKKSAICGTDLHIYRWDEWSQNTIKIPMTIGHEYVGTVA